MSTQLSFKSTVRRSSRLNPTFKKNLGFQKLEIEFISKSKKRPRNDSKVSPVLFDSPDDLTGKSQNQSKLDVKFTKFAVKNGTKSEDVNSQTPITRSAFEATQSSDTVSHSLVASSLDGIKKFVNSGLNSQDFAAEIRKLASEGLNSQNFANAIKEFSNDSLNSQNFADAIVKFVNDSLNSQDFANDMGRPPNYDLNTQDLVDPMKKIINEGPNSQDFADEPSKFTGPNLGSLEFAAPCSQNAESTEVETALKSKPVRNQRKAPSTVCDGNILPENFRKSTTRAAKKPAAEKSVTQKMPKSRNEKEPVLPCKTNTSSEAAKNLQPVSDLKRKRDTSAVTKPAKRKLRNNFSDISTLVEPLKIEVVSQKSVPCDTNVSFDPANNLQQISEQKRGRKPRSSVAQPKRKSRNLLPSTNPLLEPRNVKAVPRQTNISFEPAKNLQQLSEQKSKRKTPRTSVAAKPAKRKSQSTIPDFNSLLQPVKTASQKTRPYSRKPKPPTRNPVVRRTRSSDKKQAALASAEMDLCSLFSNFNVRSAEETSTPPVKSKSEIFVPRPQSNVGKTGFLNLTFSDMFKKYTNSAYPEELSDFTDTFSMKLNVGNFSQTLNVMSLLRQVTKIEKRLPHYVPVRKNWYENFDIW